MRSLFPSLPFAENRMKKYLSFALVVLSFTSGAVFAIWITRGAMAHAEALAHAQPPKSIVICGITDHPCVTYAVSYHEPTHEYGDGPAEGFTDYRAKTISIASSSDAVKNVQALVHEAYHAALWERGVREREKWDLHSWIYFSEGPFSMVLHDNPDLMRYIADGY